MLKEIPSNVTEQQIIDTWRGISIQKKSNVLKLLGWDTNYPINTRMIYNGLLHLGYSTNPKIVTK